MKETVKLEELLQIDPAREEKKIIHFLNESLGKLNRDGVVIGLSGGLDSSTCAYILKKALPKKKILALVLPEKNSQSLNIEHAKLVAQELDLETEEIDLTEILEKLGAYQLIPEDFSEKEKLESTLKRISKIIGTPHLFSFGFSFLYGEKRLPRRLLSKFLLPYISKIFAFAYTKVRVRMIVLYYQALLNNFALVGTTDKTEWTVGFFDKYGDSVCDLTLLRHLYKTQIRQLAGFLGVPQVIIEKPSSGDLIGDLANETLFGLTYEKLDAILFALENGFSEKQIIQLIGVSAKTIKIIKDTLENNKKRQNLPLVLE